MSKKQSKASTMGKKGSAASAFVSVGDKTKASDGAKTLEAKKPISRGVESPLRPGGRLRGGRSLAPQSLEADRTNGIMGKHIIEPNMHSKSIEVVFAKVSLPQRGEQADAAVEEGRLSKDGRRKVNAGQRFASPIRLRSQDWGKKKKIEDRAKDETNTKSSGSKSASMGKSNGGSDPDDVAKPQAIDEIACAMSQYKYVESIAGKASKTSIASSLPFKTPRRTKNSQKKFLRGFEDKDASEDDISFVERELLSIPAQLLSMGGHCFNCSDGFIPQPTYSTDARDDHSNQVDDKIDTVEDREECEGTREREEDRAKTGEGKRERENDKSKTVKCHDNWLSHLTNYFTDANLDDVWGGLNVAKNVKKTHHDQTQARIFGRPKVAILS